MNQESVAESPEITKMHSMNSNIANRLNRIEEYSADYLGESPQNIIKRINSSLFEECSRLTGLNLIICTIDNLRIEDLTEQLPKWLKIFQNILTNGNSHMKSQCCHVCRLLFTTTKDITNFVNICGISCINQIITLLINSNTQWFVPALKCLKCILKIFSGICANMKKQIEKFIFSCIATESCDVIIASAECIPWLCVTGGGGYQKSNHKLAWEGVLSSIIATLHSCLNDFAEDWSKLNSSFLHHSTSNNLLPLLPINVENYEEKMCAFASRFVALSECLKQMILTPVSIIVTLPYHEILVLINRAAKICNFIFENFAHNRTLFTLIPKLLCATLDQLQSLILCLKKKAIPQGTMFSRFFVSCLQMTRLQNDFSSTPQLLCRSRIQVYSVLKSWIMIAGNSSGCHKISKCILEEILTDVQIKQDIVKMQSLLYKPNNKRKRKNNTSVNETGQLIKRNSYTDFKSEICYSALEVLEIIMFSMGKALPTEDVKNVYQKIMDTIMKLQNQGSLPNPYNFSKCRKMLYGVLLACIISCDSHCNQISVSAAIVMFQNGLQDIDYEVSYFCQRSLIMCNPVIHPRAPTLHVPLSTSVIPTPSSDDCISQSLPPNSCNISSHSKFTVELECSSFHQDMECEEENGVSTDTTIENVSELHINQFKTLEENSPKMQKKLKLDLNGDLPFEDRENENGEIFSDNHDESPEDFNALNVSEPRNYQTSNYKPSDENNDEHKNHKSDDADSESNVEEMLSTFVDCEPDE